MLHVSTVQEGWGAGGLCYRWEWREMVTVALGSIFCDTARKDKFKLNNYFLPRSNAKWFRGRGWFGVDFSRHGDQENPGNSHASNQPLGMVFFCQVSGFQSGGNVRRRWNISAFPSSSFVWVTKKGRMRDSPAEGKPNGRKHVINEIRDKEQIIPPQFLHPHVLDRVHDSTHFPQHEEGKKKTQTLQSI